VNVGFVHGSNDLYGASNVLLHDVAIMRDMGHHVAVQLPYSGPLDQRLRDLGCEVECARMSVLRRSDPLDLLRVNPLRKLSVLAECDLVVANSLAVTPAVLAFAGYRNRPKVVSSLHEILPGRQGTVVARMARSASDGFLTNSEATRRWFIDASRASARVEMAYPVAPEYRGTRATGSPPDGARLILAGRVSRRKGHLELARACDQLRAEGREISLTLAGAPFRSSSQLRSLQTLMMYIADRPWIDYVGELAPADLLNCMADHDLCVVAATEIESFGLVIVDAWASGLPSLAPAIGGMTEAIALVDGASYSPDEADHVGALASALRFVLDHPRSVARPRGDEPARTLCTSPRRSDAWDRLVASVV